MENFCCRVCNGGSYSELNLERAYFIAKKDPDGNLRGNINLGKFGRVNVLYVCDYCSFVFTNLEKGSLTKKEQEARERHLEKLNEIITGNTRY